MSDQPDLSTLPKRMRYVVGVLDEIVFRAPDNDSRDGLIIAPDANRKFLRLADRWEAEDREAAERDARVEELAQGMALVLWEGLSTDTKRAYRRNARRLYESGWRKEDPA